MTSSFAGSPRLLKGGLVLVDPTTSKVLRVIALQFNPDTLSRSVQICGFGAKDSDVVNMAAIAAYDAGRRG